jgi:dihydroneopterin aldolase
MASAVLNFVPIALEPDRSAPPCPAYGRQVVSLRGLRFDSPLGILPQERRAPQQIQVDVEINLGLQPLRPGDDICQVLDYRKVRQIVLDECTADHVDLLECLVGQLALCLGRLPGTLGVRVRIAKLNIFNQ